MEGILLKDPNVKPDRKVLENALGKSFKAYEELMNLITTPDYSFQPEWRYYNDGKAWLCKVVHRKKTVFWLSAWDGYFRAVFYFTEKTGAGIDSLNIDESIKKSFKEHKPIGKLLPLPFEIKGIKQIPDLMNVIRYKLEL